MPLPLCAEQVQAFHRDGFLIIPDFTTPADVRAIREVLYGLFARFHALPRRHAVDLGLDARPGGGPYEIPEINYTIELAPELRATEAFARGRAIADQLLGCTTMHTGYDHAILKPARNGRATSWHQDQAYTKDRRRGPLSSVHIWIALQDVSLAMGCMWFVPGTHRGGIVPHRPRGHRPNAHALEAADVDTSKAVACPLPAGGATVHLPRTLHYAGPNMTDRPRLAWIVEFGEPRPQPRRPLTSVTTAYWSMLTRPFRRDTRPTAAAPERPPVPR